MRQKHEADAFICLCVGGCEGMIFFPTSSNTCYIFGGLRTIYKVHKLASQRLFSLPA